jgi:hypothetical protein
MLKRLILLAAIAACGILPASAQQNVLSPVSNTFTQTTTATLAAIPSNPSRKQIQICGNTATNTLSVTFGTIVTPTATLGTPIAANACATFTPPTGSYLNSQINLIAVTGSVTVFYTEYF